MTFERKMDGFIFKAPSTRAGKKYDAFDAATGKKLASFGARGMQHFRDVIGFYAKDNHGDPKRRDAYYARHGKAAAKHSPKWFAHRYLWPTS